MNKHGLSENQIRSIIDYSFSRSAWKDIISSHVKGDEGQDERVQRVMDEMRNAVEREVARAIPIPLTDKEISLMRGLKGDVPAWGPGGLVIQGSSDLIDLVRAVSAARVLIRDTVVVDGLLAKVEEHYA